MTGEAQTRTPQPGPRKLICLFYGHIWRYHEDLEHEYTGYLERCERCGEIMQVPQ